MSSMVQLWVERIFVVGLSLLCFHSGFTSSSFRAGLPGSSKKGDSIPSWLGRAGFIGAGLVFLYIAFKAH